MKQNIAITRKTHFKQNAETERRKIGDYSKNEPKFKISGSYGR
jgi:hypothetical protein